MISKAAFSVGLGRLAVAARQTLDVPTLTVYHEAMGDEADEDSWNSFTRKAAKDGEFRDWAGAVTFPKLPDVRDAYLRAKESGRVLPFKAPPIHQPVTEDVYLDAVQSNPRKPGEGPLAYIMRIEGLVNGPKPERRTVPREEPRVVEPPYEERLAAIYEREPGEEG